MALSKVVSGGQTGVDRGALDARSRVGSLVAVCHREVATDGVREASQSRASDSPVPAEGHYRPVVVNAGWPIRGLRCRERTDGDVVPVRIPE